MINLYNDKEFSTVSEFVLWIEDNYIELMDNFDISTFILDLVGVVRVQGKGYDELVDSAVYPSWKEIQKKFANDSLYDQLIQFVKFYHSEFDFDTSLLLGVLNYPENKKKFEEILEKYSIS